MAGEQLGAGPHSTGRREEHLWEYHSLKEGHPLPGLSYSPSKI